MRGISAAVKNKNRGTANCIFGKFQISKERTLTNYLRALRLREFRFRRYVCSYKKPFLTVLCEKLYHSQLNSLSTSVKTGCEPRRNNDEIEWCADRYRTKQEALQQKQIRECNFNRCDNQLYCIRLTYMPLLLRGNL